MDMKNIDWNGVFKKYSDPQAVKDFDKFLDDLPMNVGYNALIAAGIAWILAGGTVLFASQEMDKVSKTRAELMKVQALQPPIPVLKEIPVPQATLKEVTKNLTEIFKGISIVQSGDGKLTVSAQDTDFFPQFLAALSYIQRGGASWKVNIETFCAGRECQGSKLSATLKIDLIKVGDPELAKEGGDAAAK